MSHAAERNVVSIPAAALTLAASLSILPLIWFEYHNSLRPSSILTAYLLIAIMCDVVQTRTLFLRHLRPASAINLAGVLIKTAILVLNSLNKKQYLRETYTHEPIESLSSLLNRSLLWWLKPLFQAGLQRPLLMADLDNIDHTLKAATLEQRARYYWSRRCEL